MPARRKKRTKKLKNKKRSIVKYLIILILGLVIYICLHILFTEGEWDGENKLNIVVNGSEHITVIALDPKERQMVAVQIPSDTEVEVARNLGRWKLGSVWELGKNEGVGGKLLAETVTRYFGLPVYSYINEAGESLFDNNILSLATVVFYPFESSISKKDIFKIARFSAGVKNPDKRIIELKDTNLLKPEELKAGGMGHTKIRDFPQWVIAPFSNEEIANNLTTAKIISNSSNKAVSTELGRVVEATGAKVAQIVSGDSIEGDCHVQALQEKIGMYYAKLFDCSYDHVTDESFDIVITINEGFIDRF